MPAPAFLPPNHLRSHHRLRLTARVAGALYQSARAIERNREHPPLGPPRAHFDFVPPRGQLGPHLTIDSILRTDDCRQHVVRIKGRWKMCARELGRFDRLLEIHSEIDQVQKELQRPLILLISTRRSERKVWLGTAHRHRWGQGGAWTLPRPQ